MPLSVSGVLSYENILKSNQCHQYLTERASLNIIDHVSQKLSVCLWKRPDQETVSGEVGWEQSCCFINQTKPSIPPKIRAIKYIYVCNINISSKYWSVEKQPGCPCESFSINLPCKLDFLDCILSECLIGPHPLHLSAPCLVLVRGPPGLTVSLYLMSLTVAGMVLMLQ